MSNPFDNFPNYFATLYSQTPDNQAILQATTEIHELKQQPGFAEYVLQLCVQSDNPNYQLFLLTQIVNQVKEYWENEGLYQDKAQFRQLLLQIMYQTTGNILANVAEIISIICKSDYPAKWPNLMEELVSQLTEAPFEKIYAILYTASKIFKRFDFIGYSDPVNDEISKRTECWQAPIITLLSSTLINVEPCAPLEDAFNFCFQIIKSLCAHGIPEYFNENLPSLFQLFHSFMTLEIGESFKITLCEIMKMLIVRCLHEIKHWGQSNKEEEKKDPEQIELLNQSWIQLYLDLFAIAAVGSSDSLVIAAFDALNNLARSQDKGFFIDQGNLQQFCTQVLIPCSGLSEEDIELFDNNRLEYFNKDIEGLEMETKRRSAYTLLRTLGRTFREELNAIFLQICQQLMAEYNQNPQESWAKMDTAMFIMNVIIAKTTLLQRGVTEIIDGFDLSSFINSFILPALNSAHQILQADAIKFLVDYRNVMEPQIIVAIFPLIISMLVDQDNCTTLYAAYFIDRILLCKQFEAAAVVFQQVDVGRVIQRLINMLYIDGVPNVIAPRCLLQIIVKCGPALQSHIAVVVQTCVQKLTEICSDPKNPSFNHDLFEIIVASINYVKVPVQQIEQGVLRLFNKILTENVTDFIPYVFQIIGCFLLNYPDEIVQTSPDTFYAQQFSFFLQPDQWLSKGNIPALSLLVRAYCAKLPQLVIANIEPVLIICQHLLQTPTNHQYAFMIFSSMLAFLDHQYIFTILPQIYNEIINQLANPELKKYSQGFALFLADACYFLEPDNALKLLGENLQPAVEKWAESLPLIHGRAKVGVALLGVMKTLLQATVLEPPLWEKLFVGVVSMLERPSMSVQNEDIEVMRLEEQEAKEFDTTFSKLRYAEIPSVDDRPELREITNYVEFMARQFAAFSQAHPGVLSDVVQRNFEPYMQKAFIGYQETYQIQFL